MTPEHPRPAAPPPHGADTAAQLADTLFAFTPVPHQRQRADGWSPETQRRFVLALQAMGSVGRAARAVGMNRASAYRLRERPGANSFAAAWDQAIEAGRARMFAFAMERALDGVTTIRVLRGGAIDIGHGPDMALVRAALREKPAPDATKATL